MRKIVLLTLSWVITCAVNAQTTYAYRYWTDNNISTLAMGDAVGEKSFDIDISSLSPGIHALHLQARKTDGKWSAVRTRYFFKTEQTTTDSTARYWFDNDKETIHTGVATSGLVNLDISRLTVGFHAVHYQTFNSKNVPSTVRTRFFYVDQIQIGTLSAKIWIDEDEAAAGTYRLSEEDIVLDVSTLEVGMHEVHVALYDIKGTYLGTGSAEFEIPIPMTTITLTSAGLGTFCWDVDLDFSEMEDLKAYTATGYNSKTGEVTMGRVKDVPAGTGVILLGNEGEYQVPQLPSYSYYANILVGVNEPTYVKGWADGYANYILQTGQYGIGFYQNDYTVDAGTAYLHVPSTQAGAKRRIRIIFDDNMISNFGKGRITLNNITSLISTYLGENGLPKSVADVDSDGRITVEDITKLILMYLESDDE